MGILPEALMNYLALLGWAPSGGDREIFLKSELIKEFSLERVTPSPAVFDTEKLHWLNRHYLKQAPAERIHALGIGFLQRACLLPPEINGTVSGWAVRLVDLLAPYVDQLDQLPERANIVFRFNAASAVSAQENAEVFASLSLQPVIKAFAQRAVAEPVLTVERFNAIMNEVKAETGAKGKDLFHPVRVALIGIHSGPAFDKLIPLIEDGSLLELPVHVKSVRERLQEFLGVLQRRP
jgi:glutamyl-tRNA synthetase/nondiscriminating glutamyl-tRNA synthetase